jgi:hypothetical protein
MGVNLQLDDREGRFCPLRHCQPMHTHLKLTASLSHRRCHHQRVSALCSAALAVTLAWKRPICLSTMAVNHSAGESWYWLNSLGTREGSSDVSTRRIAARLASLRVREQEHEVQVLAN